VSGGGQPERAAAVGWDRREFVRAALAAPLGAALLAGCTAAPGTALDAGLDATDEQLLDEIERAAWHYFADNCHPLTGLAKDRCGADGPDSRVVASMAATGFALTAACIAERRGWIERAELLERIERTLAWVEAELVHHRGFWFHFVDHGTGARVWRCEVSTIDTALFLFGAITAGVHCDSPRIRGLVDRLVDRVDWTWLRRADGTVGHGWRPETGPLAHGWEEFSEASGLYLLAIGARRHALDPSSWRAWRRPVTSYREHRFIGDRVPLFTHQYSQAWFDLRGRLDDGIDWFENSRTATLAHRDFCLQLRSEHPHFAPDRWGFTASDSAKGYVAWGGPPAFGPIDGTVVPCAAAGSLPFAPDECLAVLRRLRHEHGERIWRRYGFVDAFHPDHRWVAPDVIGIDVGISMLMAENLRSGAVWRWFMQDERVQRGLRLTGLGAASEPLRVTR
jgi:hypothetical protein